MRYLYIILLCIGCTKNQDKVMPEICNFPYPSVRENDVLSSTNYGSESVPYTPKEIKYLIYLEYRSTLINNPYWNGGIPFYTKAVIKDTTIQKRMVSFANIFYGKWKLAFTMDSVYYKQFSGMKDKIHMVSNEITEDGVNYKLLIGYASGVAFINGLYYNEINDGFVFPNIFPNTKYFTRDVGSTVVHEAGHMAGLYHQTDYDINCAKVNEYRYGCFMGNPFYPSKFGWTTGTSSRGCTIYQNDSLTLDKNLTY